jgi:uncharacterized protein (TIGR03545 family)
VIRWGRLSLIVAPVLLIWVGAHYFLDRGIKRTLEIAGTAAVGARVDVADVSTSFWRLTVAIRGLAVTDPDHPMTNSIEIGTLRLHLQPKPLFWKKMIVERAEILGIRTGTPRKTSGALKKKEKQPPSATEKLARETAETAKGNLKEAYDPKKLISPENLLSYRKAITERDRLTGLADQWKSRTKDLADQDLAQRTQDFVNKVKNEKFSGLEGVAKAQVLLKEGQDLKNELSAAQKELKSLGSDLTREVAEAKGTLKEIDRLRRQDIDTAIAQVKEGLSPEGLTKGLLGPGGFAKLEKALDWIERARALNEKGQRKGSPPPRARIGRDVPFPFHHRWPTFHLMKATLSGETPGGLAYEGTLMDVTSDPKLLGKPSLLNLSGQAGERALTVLASLDLTTKTPSETVNATYIGLPLKDMKLGELRGTPVSIQEGSGAINLKLHASGPALDGTIHLKAANMKVGRLTSDKTDRVTAAVENVLAKITEASIGVDVAGTIKNPRFSLNSTLDNQLRAAVKKALEEEVATLRADVEKEVARLVDKETEKLSKLINTSAGPALEKINLGEKNLGMGEDQIKKILDDLAQQGTKSLKLPDIKGFFKKK